MFLLFFALSSFFCLLVEMKLWERLNRLGTVQDRAEKTKRNVCFVNRIIILVYLHVESI